MPSFLRLLPLAMAAVSAVTVSFLVLPSGAQQPSAAPPVPSSSQAPRGDGPSPSEAPEAAPGSDPDPREEPQPAPSASNGGSATPSPSGSPSSPKGGQGHRVAPRDDYAPRGKIECRPEKPQEFLKRHSFVGGKQVKPAANERAIRWRIETYGGLPGVEGVPSGGRPAFEQAKSMRFMGLPIQMHAKAVEPLVCVEREIRKKCHGSKAYVPRAIGGFRSANTYRHGEVSNHLFGIAIDIDPARNPCCGCVDPWPTHPACKDPTQSAFEKTALPRCWIDSFEHNGFYWLGRDQLEDTMHFEYLGDPDQRHAPKRRKKGRRHSSER